MQSLDEIVWPSVVKYKDTEELQFVASLQDWLNSPEVASVCFQNGDLLIDSNGLAYSLPGNEHQFPDSAQQLSLTEVIELVRSHASICGHCCVSKLGAPSIRDALQLVEVIE